MGKCYSGKIAMRKKEEKTHNNLKGFFSIIMLYIFAMYLSYNVPHYATLLE